MGEPREPDAGDTLEEYVDSSPRLVDLTWVDRLPLADGVRASDPRWAEKRVGVAERVAPAVAVARELGLLRGQNANPNVAPTIGA